MSEAPAKLDLAEDPLGGWWSAGDTPPEGRVPYRRADTVVDREVAEKMKAALTKAHSAIEDEVMFGDADTGGALDGIRAALAAYEEAVGS